jgi:hypothetical protein
MMAEAFADLARRLLDREQWVACVPLNYREGLQTLPWEIFQGHLVATRERRTFWAASVFTGEQELFSLKFDSEHACVHVTRCVENYIHEPVDSPEGLTTRETTGWERELIVTLPLAHPQLETETRLALQRAVWGARLPLTAEEAPHPLFTFGRLAYGLAHAPVWRQLEARLRLLGSSATDEYHAWREQGNDPATLPGVVRAVFDDLSLTPWTDVPTRLLDLVALALSPDAAAEWYARLTLLLTRHLSAYDLHAFHHGGMNYPDALVLHDLHTRLTQGQPGRTPTQRRALRQGWLLRQEYTLYPVPELPTSPGEMRRVLPGERGNERRTRNLFAEPWAVPTQVLVPKGLEDIEELGAAVYLDRPLGVSKQGIEPDATPLVASLLYSASLAAERWRRLSTEPAPDLVLSGVPLAKLVGPNRAACLSLTDARRVRDDWVVRRTLPGSMRRLGLIGHVFVCTPEGWTLWDDSYQVIRTWSFPKRCDYVWREGVEWPTVWPL